MSLRTLILSLIGVVLFTALVFASFFAPSTGGVTIEKPHTNFSGGDALYRIEETRSNVFVWKTLTAQDVQHLDNNTRGKFFFRELSPIDGVYYEADTKNPIKVERQGRKVKVHVEEGVYFFVLNDAFSSYEIESSTMHITQLGQGMFLLNNRAGDRKVYSVNAFLRVGPMMDDKIVTEFTLFPSLLFAYNPRYTRNLKGADILRISDINPITYVDTRSEEGLVRLITKSEVGDEDDFNKRFVTLIREDLQQDLKEYDAMYQSLLAAPVSSMRGEELATQYPALFVNASKREIHTKNQILSGLVKLLTISQKGDAQELTTAKNELLGFLDSLKESNPEAYGEALALVKSAYYLWTYHALLTPDDDVLVRDAQKDAFLGVMGSIFGSDRVGGNYFAVMSDISLSYTLGRITWENAVTKVNTYIASLTQAQGMRSSDLLPFSLYIRLFLEATPASLNSQAFTLGKHFFSFAEAAYKQIGSTMTQTDRATLLSSLLAQEAAILGRLRQTLEQQAFTLSGSTLVLKSDYYVNGDVTVPDSALLALWGMADMALGDANLPKLANLEKEYSTLLAMPDAGIGQNADRLVLEVGQTRKLLAILGDYPKYERENALSSIAQQTTGLVFTQSKEPLSEVALRNYMGKFANMDVAGMQILNKDTLVQDGYYDIQVAIMGMPFSFKLYPYNGNTIEGLVYSKLDGTTVDTFKDLTISMDERQDQAIKLAGRAKTPEEAYAYDFANFFDMVFIRGLNDKPVSTTPKSTQTPKTETNTASEMDPDVQVFLHRELIKKDFTIIPHDAFPIGLQYMSASVVGGEYDIHYNNIPTNLTGRGTYSTWVSGQYDFPNHAFTNISLQAKMSGDKDWRFDGKLIHILPESIPVTDFGGVFLKRTGFCIDELMMKYDPSLVFISCDIELGILRLNDTQYSIKLSRDN